MNILDGLNNRQKEAVTAIDGKIRVVAGAGSGKTKSLTHRYAYLVETVGIDPANILCLTFTNKAAQEMKSRIAKMVHAGNYNDYVSTIHGFCVKVLRKEIYRLGYPKTFTILDTEDQITLAKEIIKESNLDKTTVTAQQFIEEIKKSKHLSMLTYIDEYLIPKEFQKGTYEDIENDDFKAFLMKQQKAFALDFDDIILFVLYIFQNFEEACLYWQHQFDYVMVDEVQDCNQSDWSIINTITETKKNLFIVGDPDQAIYEWRGAKPEVFIDFKSDKDIILDENYRSTQSILNVANSIIANNDNRIKKDLHTNQNKEQTRIIHYHGKNETEEAQWICSQIMSLIEHKNASSSDFAILYRASYMSRSIEQELMSNHLEYIIYGGIRFFERKEIKDALCYLRLLERNDDLSFLRVVNRPSRKIGDVYKARLKAIAEQENCTLYEAMKNHIEEPEFHKGAEFVNLIETEKEKVSYLSISELLQDILKKSGLEESLRLDGDEERLENLGELQHSILYYENINAENEISLSSYLQDIALYTNMDYDEEKKGCVKLMTIHQSKGLEFPYVFVCGLTEGILPSHKTIRQRKKEGLEEERRLMYVAVTRAEKALFLTESEGYNYATRTNKYPSRFLHEIKKDYFVTEGKMDVDLWKASDEQVSELNEELTPPKFSFAENGKVKHKFFGEGIIKSFCKERQSYTVIFSNGDERTILARFLSPVDGTTRGDLTNS